MRRHNIFDEITNNEDVSDGALCAVYDLLQRLSCEFEMSAFYRIKQSLEECNERQFENDAILDIDDEPF